MLVVTADTRFERRCLGGFGLRKALHLSFGWCTSYLRFHLFADSKYGSTSGGWAETRERSVDRHSYLHLSCLRGSIEFDFGSERRSSQSYLHSIGLGTTAFAGRKGNDGRFQLSFPTAARWLVLDTSLRLKDWSGSSVESTSGYGALKPAP